MNRINRLFVILIVSLFAGFIQPVFSEDTTPLPYEQKEFPQGLKDLRRFEIITLGAMPFVTLDTTLVYSVYRYVQSGYNPEYSPNPFAASTYTTDEQTKIILTSLGVCLGIGLTDYAIQLIKRSKAKKREKLLTYDDISIYPLSEDPDATLLPEPESISENEEVIQINNDEVEEVEE